MELGIVNVIYIALVIVLVLLSCSSLLYCIYAPEPERNGVATQINYHCFIQAHFALSNVHLNFLHLLLCEIQPTFSSSFLNIAHAP